MRGKLPVLTSLVATVDAMVAPTLTPELFRGHLVAGVAVATSLADSPQTDPPAKLRHEVTRTVELIDVAVALRGTFADPKAARDGAKLTDARARLLSYRTRPLDLAFLRAALGDVWNVIDTQQGETATERPSDALEAGAQQAQHSGWLGDVGRFDIDTAVTDLTALGREGAEHVLDMLATADPEARTRIVIQIRDRGLLDNLCRPVPWARIKQLHDSLAYGYGDIKEQLQVYFLDDGDYSSQLKGMGVALVSPIAASARYPDRAKYGPTLHDERHRHSLHSMLQDAGPIGKAVDFVENVGTFGFSTDYGNAYDAHAKGETTDEEYARALKHVAGRTAVVGAVSLMTGGTADKLVRGTAQAGIVRGALAGAAGGSSGAVSGLATADSYDVYVSGDKQSFSDPVEYAKAALLGGAIGGAIAGAASRFKMRATADAHSVQDVSSGNESRETASPSDHANAIPDLAPSEPRPAEPGHQTSAAPTPDAPPPTLDEILAMETAGIRDSLKMAERYVQNPNTPYHHYVLKGGTRAIAQSSTFRGGEGTASFGGGTSVRAWIGEVYPGVKTDVPIIEFNTAGGEIPHTRLFQSRPGAYWKADSLAIRIRKIYLPNGSVATPDGSGRYAVAHPDGTVTHISGSELPE